MTESVPPATLTTEDVAALPLFTVRVGEFITPHTKPLAVTLSVPGFFSVALSICVLFVNVGFKMDT